jgi:hypothetical protein
LARVELDAFSGRPNPVWELDAVQTREFARQLAGLKAAAVSVEIPGLGYRGFLVRDAQVYRFWRGHAFRGASTSSPDWIDVGRSVERWLLKTAHGTLDPTLYAHIVQELAD